MSIAMKSGQVPEGEYACLSYELTHSIKTAGINRGL